MHIEEVIIDGFKSYATRTVVSMFDTSFNAITGLNGSGKSNILDAICFVLGISNLSQVRVSNLQELVYKGGQAGVSKATVSIVFNNTSKSSPSPAGYEECEKITVTRQIVIGGRNKYFINGHVAQPGRVQNLFHSVQLNVNNPHFLIMQGRITKVINMKPPEVLGMIEEAAGTRMYEVKKEAALKTIEKKERKVEEIEQVLATEITPMLEKLRHDRSSYMKWCNNNSRLERLERYAIAYDYNTATKKVARSELEKEEMDTRMHEARSMNGKLQDQVQTAEDKLCQLIRLREKEMSGTLRRLEEQVDTSSKLLVKKTSEWSYKEETWKGEVGSLEEVRKMITEGEGELRRKEVELQEGRKEVDKLEEDVKQVAKEEAAAERAILTGSGDGGEGDAVGSSVADQINAARRGICAADTEIEQTQLRLSHIREEWKMKTMALKNDQSALERIRREQSTTEKGIQQVKLKLHELDYDKEEADRIRGQKVKEEKELERLRERHEELSVKLSAFEFQYENPEKNFDRNKVKGFVASLLTVKNPEYSTAIEVTAGGRLYQVVVDSEQTGKSLLQRGQLKRRVTIIPLNKIHVSTITSQQYNTARQIDPSAHVALSLVGHDDDVEAAMKYVFGRTIICEDMDRAKAVTFNPQVRCRTVTLQGDMFDPAGTLTGGGSSSSMKQNGEKSVLEQLTELNRLKASISIRERAYGKVLEDLQRFEIKEKAYEGLKNELELKTHEAQLVEERLGRSVAGQLMTEVRRLGEELNVKLPMVLEAAKKQREVWEEKLKELEREGDGGNARDRAMETAERNLQVTKERHEELMSALREKKESIEKLIVEMDSIRSEIEAAKENLMTLEESVAKMEAECAKLKAEVTTVRRRFDEEKEHFEGERSKLAENDQRIGAMTAERNRLTERLEESSLELKRMEHQHKTMTKDHSTAEELVRTLEEKYAWIVTDREEFGVGGGEYDFARMDPHGAKRERDALREEQQGLAKKINKKVMTMFERAEQEYQELTSRRRIIESDKRKMENVIRELDEKKELALQTTWKKVNKDFASIFSTLLPGATAKLEPPEGCSVMAGLEIRVGFGSVWKESLSELSGGQRSLIALSLVLAMLLFKPAPMYILDEVDAALDLSHTQNIGLMLKHHFSNAQFLIVSLKEGMFNNANVVFRTKFVDGVSTISRTINRPSHRHHHLEPMKTLPMKAQDKENVPTTTLQNL